MSKPSQKPFFIGYAPMPPSLRVLLAAVSAILIGAGVGLAFLFAMTQREPGPGTWDTSEAQSFEGVLGFVPYPTLFHVRDGVTMASTLVSTGKIGVAPRVEGLDRQGVRITGFPIERDGRMTIELIDGEEAVAAAPTSLTIPQAEDLGPRTLTGEIVDSKCFFGVMKPGDGKVHKACATLCILGGIPPHLVVREPNGFSNALVTSSDGTAMPDAVLPFIGDAITVSGQLERVGPMLRFRIDPDSIERL